MTTGEKIRNLRELRNWTVDELAKAVGLQRGTVTNYELGKRIPKLDAVTALARALSVHPSAIDERFPAPPIRAPLGSGQHPCDEADRPRWLKELCERWPEVTDINRVVLESVAKRALDEPVPQKRASGE